MPAMSGEGDHIRRMWIHSANPIKNPAGVFIFSIINPSLTGETKMPRVKIDLPAPDFTRTDYQGNTVRLQDFREKSNVILVFNRGFV